MTSMRPYLLRALYEWIVDNGLTPYLLVNADHDQVEVPRQFVENGQIILNIAPMAVQGLTLDNEWVSFSARFSGRSFSVFVPVLAVLAIYAKENGKGMFFQPEEEQETSPPPP
ncbi:MAG: ClpXP protease specificity-enhancing factor [Candidatus Parabeggiatoa sp. nov. 3]|nr:MAG: ClpXP protease specificity-enhancing factor [Gammaproteobacteria bacterium]